MMSEVAPSSWADEREHQPQLAARAGRGTGVLKALAPLGQGCPEGESCPVLGRLSGMPLLRLAKSVQL